MSELYTESTLADSYIYSAFNNNKVMSARLIEIMTRGTEVLPSHLEEQLLRIKRTRLSPLMDTVIDAYSNGEIKLISSNIINIPASIPFAVGKNQQGFYTSAFVSRYGKFSKDEKIFSIQPKTLYILMESSYLAKVYYQHPERFARSAGLVKTLGNIYTLMLMRILNKEFALSLDPDLHSQISYFIARFFFDTVIEVPNREVSHSYASAIAKAGSTMELQGAKEDYELARIKNFDEFINFIRDYSKRLSTLSRKIFIQTFMNTYGTVSVLGLDCLPYFILTVTSSLMGCFLVNDTIMSDILKNTRGLKPELIYPELTKIV